jgi:hypothetical protein
MMGKVTNKCDEIKDMREKRMKVIPQARGGRIHHHQTQHKLSFFFFGSSYKSIAYSNSSISMSSRSLSLYSTRKIGSA